MAKEALAVVMATLLMGCLATDTCADANLCSDRKPLGTNLLQIVAVTDYIKDVSPTLALPLTSSEWTTSGSVSLGTETAIPRHASIQSKQTLERPATVSAEMKADSAECITMSLFASSSSKNAPYSLETGGWSNRIRIFPGDYRETTGYNNNWHSVKIEATSTEVRFYLNGELKHTVTDASLTSGSVRFIAGCVGLKVRSVVVQGGGLTSEPTPAPTPAPTNETTVAAFGDPHLKNIKKESFAIRRAGIHTLLTVPRGAAAIDTLLKVNASVERVDPGCSSLFIQSLDIMGQWLGSVPPLRFAAGSALPGEVDGAVLQVGNSSALSIDELFSKVPASMITLTVPKKDIVVPNGTNKHATLMMAALKFGPGVSMKVSWTSERIPSVSIAHSLWVSVAGLSTVHSTFGGLLGEDDHHDAATPDADCTEKGRSEMLLLGGKDEPLEVAQASLE